MDLRVRAHVLLEEADALGVTIEDLVAAAEQRPRVDLDVPTVSEHIAAIKGCFTEGTAATFLSYWRLAEARFGDRRSTPWTRATARWSWPTRWTAPASGGPAVQRPLPVTDRSSCVVKGRWCGGRTRQS